MPPLSDAQGSLFHPALQRLIRYQVLSYERGIPSGFSYRSSSAFVVGLLGTSWDFGDSNWILLFDVSDATVAERTAILDCYMEQILQSLSKLDLTSFVFICHICSTFINIWHGYSFAWWPYHHVLLVCCCWLLLIIVGQCQCPPLIFQLLLIIVGHDELIIVGYCKGMTMVDAAYHRSLPKGLLQLGCLGSFSSTSPAAATHLEVEGLQELPMNRLIYIYI